MNKKKLCLGIALLIVIAILIYLVSENGLSRYFHLHYLKAKKDYWINLYLHHRVIFILGYMALYIVLTSLSLPGATVLTIVGGAIFGLWVGVIVESFASTLGATGAFILTRYFFRDWVRGRFSGYMDRVDAGIRKEGAFYLFAIRLVPVIPFVIVNIIMGITSMRVWTFYWVSQLGMLAGTIAYVNTGKQLGKIDDVSDIVSPGLIIAFAILGILPLVGKWGVGYVRDRFMRSENRIERKD